jgi:glutathione S-transferase
MTTSAPTDDNTQPPMDLKPMRASSIQSGPLGVARVIIGLFSGTGVRDPPTEQKKQIQHVRLITIAFSHYCEKARWGLDILEADPGNHIYYTEDGDPPAFVAFATVPVSKDQASATPMIVFPDGQFLYKSNAILKELCPFLYQKEISSKISEFELDMGVRLGAALRVCVYHRFLDPSKEYYPVMADMACLYSSKVETILFRAMLDKGIDKGILKAMKISDETATKSKKMVRQVFAEVSDRLKESGAEYLMDTPTAKFGFTAADLTFAALVYPFMRPFEMSNFSMD